MVAATNLGRAVGYVHITHFLVKHESWELQVTVHSAIVSLQGQQFPKFGKCLQMAPHEQGILVHKAGATMPSTMILLHSMPTLGKYSIPRENPQASRPLRVQFWVVTWIIGSSLSASSFDLTRSQIGSLASIWGELNVPGNGLLHETKKQRVSSETLIQLT